MYIQITNRCNMSCEHCGMNCTAQGEDMTPKTFKNALSYCDEVVSIGGGEPTIHPKFKQFLFDAIGHCEYVWMATNGSMTEIALTLSKMAKKGIISCALSQDPYHDPIDEKVVEAFTQGQKNALAGEHDCREIRNVYGNEINGGRCDFGKEDGCICSGLIVRPNGGCLRLRL